MVFCPKCGASLKAEKPEAPTDWRSERRDRRAAERSEKQEKNEKGEKHEKAGSPISGPIIGGLILIFIGVMSYLSIIGYRVWDWTWPIIFIVIGLVLIFSRVMGSARRRNPPT